MGGDGVSGQIGSWVSDLSYELYFCQLCKCLQALEGIFSEQVLYPVLTVTMGCQGHDNGARSTVGGCGHALGGCDQA